MKKLILFVQDGCRPCIYAKNNLAKIKGWEDVVQLYPANSMGEPTYLAQKCDVVGTPCLVCMENGEVVAKMSGADEMNTEFWRNVILKHGPGTP